MNAHCPDAFLDGYNSRFAGLDRVKDNPFRRVRLIKGELRKQPLSEEGQLWQAGFDDAAAEIADIKRQSK